ncbi:hypothetical protein [Halosimplex pelagicum]|uniref:Uncharacterized protein n=1 Tax=Halosimplex pelagicum TaxID=869886 RepID=A0A7D5T7H8_9EURY|nr:hypothetical protein [Halosimplex pelagicum]QLH84751.1 hypothetical protein HZS54_25265 [Halosimplex pelagicum]
MYVCRCHTCGESRSAAAREHVQRFFNDHAADEHEVVLKRVESTAGPASGAPDGDRWGEEPSFPEPTDEVR